MNKGLEALGKITGTQNLTMYEQNECLRTIEEELKRLEELEKAFVALSKDDEKAKKLLSKEIEKNRVLNIINKLGIKLVIPDNDYSKEHITIEIYCQHFTKEQWEMLKKELDL